MKKNMVQLSYVVFLLILIAVFCLGYFFTRIYEFIESVFKKEKPDPLVNLDPSKKKNLMV